jgi:hypothetical protein
MALGRSCHGGGQNPAWGGLASGGEVVGEYEGITCDRFGAGVGAGGGRKGAVSEQGLGRLWSSVSSEVGGRGSAGKQHGAEGRAVRG